MKLAAVVLGMLGAFIALPAALFSSLFAAARPHPWALWAFDDPGGSLLFAGVLAAVVAFVSSIVVMVRSRAGAYGLLGALLLTVVTCTSLNPFAFVVALMLFGAMLLAFLAARDEAAATTGPNLPDPYGTPQSIGASCEAARPRPDDTQSAGAGSSRGTSSQNPWQ